MKLTDKQIEVNNFCPVCGYPLGDYNPWGGDGKTPTYDICPCCGVVEKARGIDPFGHAGLTPLGKIRLTPFE